MAPAAALEAAEEPAAALEASEAARALFTGKSGNECQPAAKPWIHAGLYTQSTTPRLASLKQVALLEEKASSCCSR